MSEPLSLDAEQALKLALLRHNSGDLAGAEELYREILSVAPQNFRALRLLGMLLRAKPENRRFVRPLPPADNPGLKKVSVVMASFNRAHLLARSLECYAAQSLKDFELIVLDDASSDSTFDLVRQWQKTLDIKYLRLDKPAALSWRDAASVINAGIRLSFGELVICTHPEVMPGFRSLELCYAARRPRAYICCKPYYLTRAQQERLDSVDWRASRLAARELPGFYDGPPALDHPLFFSRNIESCAEFESWVFGGMTRETWAWFGGFTEQAAWGAPDITFQKRRVFLGIDNLTLQDGDTYCLHQNHDLGAGAAPRDMQACFASLPSYGRLEEALERNLW